VTPVERAARALVGYESGGLCQPGAECTLCDCGLEGASPETLAEDLAQQLDRARFTITAALDVDELARVLHDAACVCDRTTHPAESWVNWTNYARAVVAHLTKGNENDE